jgi:hypothetical protein
MSIGQLLTAVFLSYGCLVGLLGPLAFGEQFGPTAYVQGAVSIILAVMFHTRRCFALNFIIAWYVGSTYLLLPWVHRFEAYVTWEQANHLRSLISFHDPETALRANGLLLFCLVAWTMGLMLAPSNSIAGVVRAPRLFRAIDEQVLQRRLSFWIVLVCLVAFQYRHSILYGWGALATGSSEVKPLLFFGLLDPIFIIHAGLLLFARAYARGREPRPYALLLPVASIVVLQTFTGSRGAIYMPGILVLCYLVALKGPRARVRLRLVALAAPAVLAAFLVGAFANTAKPLWRSATQPSEIRDFLVEEATSGRLLENGLFSTATLISRLADLTGPYHVVNDMQVQEPWAHVNPLQIVMRTVNDLVPGVVFPGMLTINQIFDWIYYGAVVPYASAYWGVLAFPYLYFGFWSPLVFFFLGLVSSVVYVRGLARVRSSPAYAAFWISLMLEVISNGTFERVVVVDIVRVVLSYFIFTLLVMTVGVFLGQPRVPRRLVIVAHQP